MCRAQGRRATRTASLAKVAWGTPTFPGDSLKTEIGRVSLKTWFTDQHLNAYCLDLWGLFLWHLDPCVYILWLAEGKVPMRNTPLARPGQRPQQAHALGHGSRLRPGNMFLAFVVYLNFSCYKYLRWFYFILII